MGITAWMELIGAGLAETLYMTVASTFFACVLGLPLGILLVVTAPGGLKPRPLLFKALDLAVNLLRSVPFLILLVAILPLTRLLTGTTIGSTATIPPLVIAAAPFVARLAEASLKEVDAGLVEAARAMGASPFQIIRRVLLAEALPSLATGAVIATTTILGYSALAGFTGGGGLGAIAVNYGYHRYQTGIMLWTVVLLILIVQLIQELGTRMARRLDAREPKRRRRLSRSRES